MSFTVQCVATGEICIVDSLDGHDEPDWQQIAAIPPPASNDDPMVLSGNVFVPAPPPPQTRLDGLIALLIAKKTITAADVATLPSE